MATQGRGALFLTLMLALIWMRPLDGTAREYSESGFKRAFVTFAAARAINATISVLKSFQVGAIASIQLGAALDPVDDLVEQFSTLMLGATVLFAAQRLLIDLLATVPVAVFLTTLLLLWGASGLRGRGPPGWLTRLAIGVLCLRFAVPVVALGSEGAYRLLLAGQYESSQRQIESTRIQGIDARSDESLAEQVRRWWTEGANIGKRIEALKAQTEAWVEHLIRLLAVFLVQTLVLPFLFLWGVLWLYRTLARPFGSRSS